MSALATRPAFVVLGFSYRVPQRLRALVDLIDHPLTRILFRVPFLRQPFAQPARAPVPVGAFFIDGLKWQVARPYAEHGSRMGLVPHSKQLPASFLWRRAS